MRNYSNKFDNRFPKSELSYASDQEDLFYQVCSYLKINLDSYKYQEGGETVESYQQISSDCEGKMNKGTIEVLQRILSEGHLQPELKFSLAFKSNLIAPVAVRTQTQ